MCCSTVASPENEKRTEERRRCIPRRKALQRCGDVSRGVRPAWQREGRGAGARGIARAQGGIADQLRQRAGESRDIIRRHEDAGAGRHGFGNRARRRGDDGQAMLHGLGEDHAIALMAAREDEDIGGVIG